ncbi:aminopeptidase N [Streptomyces sp. WMMC500]|uniref:aminopeptidase N n=1 Tax=Streptomyces sp. WMMC500 TaxID=3015154 RepID=UPI00248BA05C|nr:aminopeptidase N [Streptomyces sp. WMMC500]WBB59322.1 aminopeptidase N [Streptomyces sp. WMMC500]
MPGENLTREEARERARLLEVEAYEVELDLRTAVAPDPGPFRSVTTVRFRCAQPGAATFLDLVAPDVTAVSLNGRDLDPGAVFDGSRIALEDLAAENEVVVDARCAFSRTGEGMHRFVDPEDGEVYLYTQYEPADARRVFATFEQPDLKAPFTFTVTAPAHWTVLSGAAPAGRPERHQDTFATWRFEPTKPISTYITAVVAGPYAHLEDRYTRTLDDGRELVVPLGALCRRSLARHFDADDVFTVTKQGLDFFHDHFDYPYPWGKYDQAFVPEYNIGAMENPGLVTFREEFVFRGKVTDAAYERRANVVLHEMAHMWFGDLVTMEWWDDLWLKESFADYMGALALAEATRFTGSWITFANRRKAWAYRADQLPTTHPITADIPDLEAAKLNFDGITYAKGAAVLKQLVAYVGRDAFMEGARRYFKRHAFRNTRLADLLAALAETSGRDMSAWARSWLQTAGVDTLTPQATYDAGDRITELAVLREGPATGPGPAAAGAPPRPHRVAVGLYAQPGASGELVRYARAEVDVTDGHAVVAELAGQPRPELILVNDDDLTFCKARFDEDSLDTVRERLGEVTDPLARALLWAAAWDLTRDGLMPARDYLGLVLRFAGRETDIGVLQGLHQQAHYTVDHYAAPGHRAEAEQTLAEGALGELRLAPPGSDHQLAWARFFASVASTEQDLQLLRGLLDGQAKIDGLDVDQELRWEVLLPLAAHGAADTAAIDAELARDDTASGRRHQVRCLAARPDARVKEAAWKAVVDSDELSNAIVEATISGFTRPGQRDLLAPYAPRYFEAIERIWRERTIESAMAVVRGLYPALQAHEGTLEATDTWLRDTEGSAPPALRRLVREARDDLARALRAQARDGQG